MANNKPKQKGNGEGTLYKSSKTELYVGQYVVNGQRHSMYQRKNEKAVDFKIRFYDKISNIGLGTYSQQSNISLYKVIDSYIENKHKTGITGDRTYIRNVETLKALKKCCSNFIDKPVQKITIQDVKDALPNFVELKIEGSQANKNSPKIYSQNTIGKLYAMLYKGFKIAVSERIITYNIMDNESIKKPKSKKETEKVEALTIEEEKELIKILNEHEHKYNNIILLGLYTGMRIGEILALTQSNINLKEGTIIVDKSLTRDINDKVILGNKTKTRTGMRTIYLSDSALALLKKICNSSIANMYDLVFYDYKKNTFITPTEVNCYLQRLNDKYHFCSHIHTHMLRHTYATRCIEARNVC